MGMLRRIYEVLSLRIDSNVSPEDEVRLGAIRESLLVGIGDLMVGGQSGQVVVDLFSDAQRLIAQDILDVHNAPEEALRIAGCSAVVTGDRTFGSWVAGALDARLAESESIGRLVLSILKSEFHSPDLNGAEIQWLQNFIVDYREERNADDPVEPEVWARFIRGGSLPANTDFVRKLVEWLPLRAVDWPEFFYSLEFAYTGIGDLGRLPVDSVNVSDWTETTPGCHESWQLELARILDQGSSLEALACQGTGMFWSHARSCLARMLESSEQAEHKAEALGIYKARLEYSPYESGFRVSPETDLYGAAVIAVGVHGLTASKSDDGTHLANMMKFKKLRRRDYLATDLVLLEWSCRLGILMTPPWNHLRALWNDRRRWDVGDLVEAERHSPKWASAARDVERRIDTLRAVCILFWTGDPEGRQLAIKDMSAEVKWIDHLFQEFPNECFQRLLLILAAPQWDEPLDRAKLDSSILHVDALAKLDQDIQNAALELRLLGWDSGVIDLSEASVESLLSEVAANVVAALPVPSLAHTIFGSPKTKEFSVDRARWRRRSLHPRDLTWVADVSIFGNQHSEWSAADTRRFERGINRLFGGLDFASSGILDALARWSWHDTSDSVIAQLYQMCAAIRSAEGDYQQASLWYVAAYFKTEEGPLLDSAARMACLASGTNEEWVAEDFPNTDHGEKQQNRRFLFALNAERHGGNWSEDDLRTMLQDLDLGYGGDGFIRNAIYGNGTKIWRKERVALRALRGRDSLASAAWRDFISDRHSLFGGKETEYILTTMVVIGVVWIGFAGVFNLISGSKSGGFIGGLEGGLGCASFFFAIPVLFGVVAIFQRLFGCGEWAEMRAKAVAESRQWTPGRLLFGCINKNVGGQPAPRTTGAAVDGVMNPADFPRLENQGELREIIRRAAPPE